MTPQERKLLDELFDRLATLESAPRDPEAAAAINDGLRRAPNALYPLVQSVLVQDEALKRADARIRTLESELGIEPEQPQQQPGFLDSMRDALLGRRDPHGSVPSVRPGGSPWRNAPAQQPAAAPQSAPLVQPYAAAPGPSGGSFLGTAAATAAGVVGGALLMNSFRGMFGGSHGQPAGAFDSASGGGAPWGPSSGGDLARQAGIDDMGRGGRTAAYDDPGSERAGLFDVAENEPDADIDSDFDVGGDSDLA
jgi:uncharacterized protein